MPLVNTRKQRTSFEYQEHSFVKPPIEDLLHRIQALAPDERLRLISELEKHKEELGHAARPELLAEVLSELGLVELKSKAIEVETRSKPKEHAQNLP
jgi:hypothetical protein